MGRDDALQVVRERYEAPVWSLVEQLQRTLADLAKVEHIDLADSRAIGSVLNGALANAAVAADLSAQGLEAVYVQKGQSYKLAGTLRLAGKDFPVSFELHLSGPRGGTSKSSHQFVAYDIEGEPSFPGFEMEAPAELLFFVACYLNGTGASIARVFIKFADGVDQRMIELHRAAPPATAVSEGTAPLIAPTGTKLVPKKSKGERIQNGSTADKRGDAASSS